jgi:hypothetical protein
MNRAVLLVVTAINLFAGPKAFADALALTPSETGGYGHALYEYGFSFHVNSPISVTALAYFKNDGESLQNSHVVSLWSNTGPNVPLATAVVDPSDPALIVPYSPHPHFFYYSAITPLLLMPGDYVVAGTPSEEDVFFQSNSVVSGPEITFLDGRWGSVVDGRPTGQSLWAMFGGNFLYEPAAVPEPSSGLCLVLGAGLAAGALHRRNARRTKKAA